MGLISVLCCIFGQLLHAQGTVKTVFEDRISRDRYDYGVELIKATVLSMHSVCVCVCVCVCVQAFLCAMSVR